MWSSRNVGVGLEHEHAILDTFEPSQLAVYLFPLISNVLLAMNGPFEPFQWGKWNLLW